MQRVLIPIVLAALAGLVGCGRVVEEHPSPEETTLTVLGQPAPAFESSTLAGERVVLADQAGRVVLLSFFATWCGPCRAELPHLETDVWQRFKDREFTMLALGREHTEEELRPFVEEAGVTFPVAVDPERLVYQLYAEQYIPRNVVVGGDGTVIFQSTGFERDEFEQMIEKIEQALGDGKT